MQKKTTKKRYHVDDFSNQCERILSAVTMETMRLYNKPVLQSCATIGGIRSIYAFRSNWIRIRVPEPTCHVTVELPNQKQCCTPCWLMTFTFGGKPSLSSAWLWYLVTVHWAGWLKPPHGRVTASCGFPKGHMALKYLLLRGFEFCGTAFHS